MPQDVHELMNAKRQLLQQQKEQTEVVAREESSEQAASILVNNLLMQGFHISAPSKDNMGSTLLLPQKNDGSKVDEEKVSAERQKLIKAFHKELVRVSAVAEVEG